MTEQPSSTLAARIVAGHRLRGGLLRMPNPYLVELCGLHGLDYVAIDCEHGPAEISLLQQHILTAQAYTLPVLVRIPGSDVDAVGRILDAGAAGLIVPHVRDADAAQAVVAAATYPSEGRRGFAAYTPAARYGLLPITKQLAATPVIVAMIEDANGVDNAAAIASVPGVTGILVGPADLATTLGHAGELEHDDVRKAISAVHDQTRQAGKAVVVITGTAAGAATAFGHGAQLVVYNLAHALNDTFAALTAARPAGDQTPPTTAITQTA